MTPTCDPKQWNVWKTQHTKLWKSKHVKNNVLRCSSKMKSIFRRFSTNEAFDFWDDIYFTYSITLYTHILYLHLYVLIYILLQLIQFNSRIEFNIETATSQRRADGGSRSLSDAEMNCIVNHWIELNRRIELNFKTTQRVTSKNGKYENPKIQNYKKYNKVEKSVCNVPHKIIKSVLEIPLKWNFRFFEMIFILLTQ